MAVSSLLSSFLNKYSDSVYPASKIYQLDKRPLIGFILSAYELPAFAIRSTIRYETQR